MASPRRHSRCGLALGVAVLLGFCSIPTLQAQAEPIAKVVSVSESDAGSSVALELGDELEVKLRSTPSAGYRWELEGGLGAPLQALGSSEQRVPGPPRMGEPVEEVFRFRAAQEGSLSLFFVYRRSFELERPATRSFRIEVTVRAGT